MGSPALTEKCPAQTEGGSLIQLSPTPMTVKSSTFAGTEYNHKRARALTVTYTMKTRSPAMIRQMWKDGKIAH